MKRKTIVVEVELNAAEWIKEPEAINQVSHILKQELKNDPHVECYGCSLKDNSTETKLFKAVKHILSRICKDERVAYQLGYMTESLRLLVDGYAAATNQTVEEVNKEVNEALRQLPLKRHEKMLELGWECLQKQEEKEEEEDTEVYVRL